MFIGHLPVGYLVSSVTYPRLKSPGIGRRGYLIAGMAGAVAPDLDLLYFYLIDQGRHNHRSYWTHYPSIWLCLLVVALLFRYAKRGSVSATFAMIFSINGLIHMMLDSIAGYVYWLRPLDDEAYGLVTVSSVYEPWWLNFFFHWTFLCEMGVMFWAVLVWRKGRVKNPSRF